MAMDLIMLPERLSKADESNDVAREDDQKPVGGRMSAKSISKVDGPEQSTKNLFKEVPLFISQKKSPFFSRVTSQKLVTTRRSKK